MSPSGVMKFPIRPPRKAKHVKSTPVGCFFFQCTSFVQPTAGSASPKRCILMGSAPTCFQKERPPRGWSFRRLTDTGVEYILVLPPLKPAASRCPPGICILMGSAPTCFQKERPPRGWSFFLEQDTGVEPAFTAWEAVVLPIYESCGFREIIIAKGLVKSNHFLSVTFSGKI